MNPYFIFKGISSVDKKILISQMPDIVKPDRRVNVIQIPGKNGALYEDDGTYENYTLSFECGMRGISDIDTITSWLTGWGDLTISTEPDKVYRACIINKVPFSDVIWLYNSFIIQFDVYPLKYSVNKADEELELTTGATIYNRGTYYSEPIITVYGSGNINLTINGITYGLQAVNGHITINTEMQEVYKDGVNCNNQFLAEDFPIFQCGDNSISWTGSVTKIKIEPNWRWL